jgi:hypothetical protein
MPSPHEAVRAAGSSDPREFGNLRRRRSHRLKLPVRVLVYGWATGNSPFNEIVYTLSVNVHGGLIALTAAPQPGELVLLMNTFTDEEQQCRVVHVGPEHGGKREVGFELMYAGNWFWSFDSFPTGTLVSTGLSENTKISSAAPPLKWKSVQKWWRRLHGIELKNTVKPRRAEGRPLGVWKSVFK